MSASLPNIQHPADLRQVLLSLGLLQPDEPLFSEELSGGVSNTVMLVKVGAEQRPLILKQALPQLKVKEDWFCAVERIWREVEVLKTCEEILAVSAGEGRGAQEPLIAETPKLLGEDRSTYCYAMTSAPIPHSTWKQELLRGNVSPEIARACGVLLAKLHGRSWHVPPIAKLLDDRAFFDSLRLDPYYRFMGRAKHPALNDALTSLVEETLQQRHCLVHGDFSPKNLLVAGEELWLIDFEVGHYGDPAFDLGFFGTHLVLKAVWATEQKEAYRGLIAEFWKAYQQTLATIRAEEGLGPTAEEVQAISARASRHLVACCLARVDGKSPVDYLRSEDQARVRKAMCECLAEPAEDFAARFERLLES